MEKFYIGLLKMKSVNLNIETVEIVIGLFLAALIVLLILNITKTRRINRETKENIEFIRTIIDAFPNILSVRDKNGKIIFANKPFAELYNFSNENIEGKTFVEIGAESNIPLDELIQFMRDDYNTIVEFTSKNGVEEKLVMTDGTVRWFITNKVPVMMKGKKECLIKISSEITERKKMEEALLEAKDKAESANEAKSRFVANMSHEIRTPLNSIIGMADVLMRENINAAAKKEAEIIYKSADRLLYLINDILDFSKIEAGAVKVENEEFNIYEEIKKTLEIIERKAIKKGLYLVLACKSEIPERIIGDRVKIMQVITNLISNAVKFTNKGGIIVKVRSKKIGENLEIKVDVEDTGIGIPEEKKELIFEKFSQIDDSYAKKNEGSGLGLSISKGISDLVRGNIEFVSEEGRGSIFSFSFPVNNVKENIHRKIENKIIIIHLQQKNIISSLIYVFGKSGFELIVAENTIELEAIFEELMEEGKEMILLTDKSCLNDLEIKVNNCREITIKYNELIDSRLLENEIENLRNIGHMSEVVQDNAFEKSQTSMSILLVEDNEYNRETFKTIIQTLGFKNLIMVEDAKTAIALVKKEKFDIIFTDIQLPEIDGFQMTKIIREEAEFKKIPIIALTAHVVEGFREKCIEANMDDYISKPITIAKLTVVLKKWFNYIVEERENIGVDNENQKRYEAILKILNKIEILKKGNEFERIYFEIHKIKGVISGKSTEKIDNIIQEIEYLLNKKENLKAISIIKHLNLEIEKFLTK